MQDSYFVGERTDFKIYLYLVPKKKKNRQYFHDDLSCSIIHLVNGHHGQKHSIQLYTLYICTHMYIFIYIYVYTKHDTSKLSVAIFFFVITLGTFGTVIVFFFFLLLFGDVMLVFNVNNVNHYIVYYLRKYIKRKKR